jgi:hypothetical protein
MCHATQSPVRLAAQPNHQDQTQKLEEHVGDDYENDVDDDWQHLH